VAAEAEVLAEVAEQQAREAYAQLPLYFIENQGQSDKRVAYYAQQGGANLYFTAEEMVMTLPSSSKGESQGEGGIVLWLRFLDANPNVQIRGNQEQEARFNYFIGDDPAKWRSDVPSYGEVVYRELYPGVDLVYSGRNDSLKYTFLLQPGADVDNIRLAYESADGLRIAENGDLLIATAAGDLRDAAPYVYQEIGSERVTVDAAFTLYDAQTYGFEVGRYDPRYPLVLDPTLLYSTFLGGSDGDYGESIALADSGAVYVTGRTVSGDFPTTTGAYTTTHNGSYDVFVSALTSDLSSLSYSTFLGGSSDDYGYAIALDDVTDHVYLTGGTFSSDFPTTTGAYTTTHNGTSDVFVSVLTPDLGTLSYATFLGGSSSDYGYAIALADSSAVYVTGRTQSSGFPTTTGVYTTTHNGGYDVFVSVLPSDLSSLSYSTFLGGSSDDYGESIALDDAGHAYLTGYTYGSDFPTTTGAYTTTHNGASDVFVSVLTPDLSDLSCSTFLGGSTADESYAIALDGEGNVYLTGVTSSNGFPTTVGAYDTTHYGPTDVFVSVLTSDLSDLSYSTFLGGYLDDYGESIALDGAGPMC